MMVGIANVPVQSIVRRKPFVQAQRKARREGLNRGGSVDSKEAWLYVCQNANCRSMVVLPQIADDETREVRCDCGGIMKKKYEEPVFRQLPAEEVARLFMVKS